MPFQRLDDDDVIALAAELGIRLTGTERRKYSTLRMLSTNL